MVRLIALGLVLLCGAAAADVNCIAKVTNRRYTVTLTTSVTPAILQVVTDTGFQYSGATSYNYSPSQILKQYFLPVDWTNGLLLETDRNGAAALCLASTECYDCN